MHSVRMVPTAVCSVRSLVDATVSFPLCIPSSASNSDGSARRHVWEAVWSSGLLLARLLASLPPRLLADHHVLELGCGCAGLPARICAAGGASVVATDGSDQALAWLASCLQLQKAPLLGTLQLQKLNWSPAASAARRLPEASFDIVLAADCMYIGSAVRALVETAAALLRPGGIFLLADPGRSYNEEFLLQALGLEEFGPREGGTWSCRLWKQLRNIPILGPTCSMPVASIGIFQKRPGDDAASSVEGWVECLAALLAMSWHDAQAVRVENQQQQATVAATGTYLVQQ